MKTNKSEVRLQSEAWVLYILECADQSLYTGITNRLSLRLEAHQKGTGAKYTRSRLPVKLVYTESCNDRSHASKREYAVKNLTRSQKQELIKATEFLQDFSKDTGLHM